MAGLSATASGQDVPPVDFSQIAPDDFGDDELAFAYYLAHFPILANSVRMSEPDRGFIDLAVWREPDWQTRHNARVMENVLSLAFFYATDRPWNPYYAHPSVRQRLEAALSYWVRLQRDDGLFTEFDPSKGEISPTGFGIKFISETLRLLNEGPPIDQKIISAVAEAIGKATGAFLRNDDFFAHGRDYTNHYTTVWGGALAYLSHYSDDELSDLLFDRLQQGLREFQSPAGFFYERRGPDWVFELDTHQSNHLMTWHYLRNTDLAAPYLSAMERWYEWLAFNSVLEPDGSGFFLNHAIETRLDRAFYPSDFTNPFGRSCFAMAEQIVLAQAFCESEEERAHRLTAARAKLESSWPDVPDLRVGDFYGYSPAIFLHHGHIRWHPSQQQKDEARKQLPYLKLEEFIHRLTDDRTGLTVTFIRRTAYYAAFNLGKPTDKDQRYGIGFLWTPENGTFVQSHSEDGLAWGTRPDRAVHLYEAEITGVRLPADITYSRTSDDHSELDRTEEVFGTHEPFSIKYRLGSGGQKSVTFDSLEITVAIEHEGAFTESIPLLLKAREPRKLDGDSVQVAPKVVIAYENATRVHLRPTTRRIGRKQVHILELEASDSLRYVFHFQETEDDLY